jgi:hypothetical protein
MALDKNQEIGVAALAAVTVGGLVYYLSNKSVKAPETGKVVVKNDKPILVKPIRVNFSDSILNKMTDEEKLALGSQSKTTKAGDGKLYIANPIRLSDNLNLDYIRNKGILGRLVAQYYAFERARVFYMKKCGAFSFCDDSPAWLQRDKQLIHKSDVDKALKKEWFGVGLSNANFLDRWDGGNSKSKLWRRRYSLESTFSNWSAPMGFAISPAYMAQQHGWNGELCPKLTYHFSSAYKKYIERPPENPRFFPETHDGEFVKCADTRPIDMRYLNTYECINGKKHAALQTSWEKFWYGDYQFGQARLNSRYGAKILQGYQYSPDQAKGQYAYVCPKNSYGYDQIPWRNFKGVSDSDILKATYKLPLEHDFFKRWKRQHAIGRYYHFGYILVRTALDILCSRKEPAEDYPEFATHCTWWGIPQPNREFVARYPDLTAIGSGVNGLADVKTPELIKYVMSITPKPGTIVPWEDKGPLYTWPESTGYMQPLPIAYRRGERSTSDVWGQVVQYIISVETSICANMASGFVDTAVDAVLDYAETVFSEWLTTGLEAIMANIENSPALQAVIKEIKSIMKDVSGFSANMARFIDAEQLIGALDQGANISKVLAEYLDLVTDGAPPRLISNAKSDAIALTDSLRRQWDWADELLGSAASMGTRVTDITRKDIKDAVKRQIPKV